MLNNLPVAYRKDQWVNDLLNALMLEDGKQRADAKDTAAQILLDSMTWHLPAEEIEAGLTVSTSTPIEQRRAALSAKWRSGAGRVGIEHIRTVCEAWEGTRAEVTYDGHRLVTVFIERGDGVPDNAAAMLDVLRKTIPAHLLFWFIVCRPEASAGIYIGGAVTACSRRTLMHVEPNRSVSDTVYAAGTSGVCSQNTLRETPPDRSASALIWIGGMSEATSRVQPAEPKRSSTASVCPAAGYGGVSRSKIKEVCL